MTGLTPGLSRIFWNSLPLTVSTRSFPKPRRTRPTQRKTAKPKKYPMKRKTRNTAKLWGLRFTFRRTKPTSTCSVSLFRARAVLSKRLSVLKTSHSDEIVFPWFADASDLSPDEIKAYTAFISALCKLSANAKRVSMTEKPVDNEKYAFRCFLLRLGFIGREHKITRKILLRNLEGSSAFKNGGADDETSE